MALSHSDSFSPPRERERARRRTAKARFHTAPAREPARERDLKSDMCQRRLDWVGLVLKRDKVRVYVGGRRARSGVGEQNEGGGREASESGMEGMLASANERAAVTGARLFLSARRGPCRTAARLVRCARAKRGRSSDDS